MKLITASKNEYTPLTSIAAINYVTIRPMITITFAIGEITVENVVSELKSDGFSEFTIATDAITKVYTGYKYVAGFSERITDNDASLLLILSTEPNSDESITELT